MHQIDTGDVAQWVAEIVREKHAAGDRLRAAHQDPETAHLLWAWADSAFHMVEVDVLAALERRNHPNADASWTSAEADLAATIADACEAIAELNKEPKVVLSQVGESVVFLTAWGASLLNDAGSDAEEPF